MRMKRCRACEDLAERLREECCAGGVACLSWSAAGGDGPTGALSWVPPRLPVGRRLRLKAQGTTGAGSAPQGRQEQPRLDPPAVPLSPLYLPWLGSPRGAGVAASLGEVTVALLPPPKGGEIGTTGLGRCPVSSLTPGSRF